MYTFSAKCAHFPPRLGNVHSTNIYNFKEGKCTLNSQWPCRFGKCEHTKYFVILPINICTVIIKKSMLLLLFVWFPSYWSWKTRTKIVFMNIGIITYDILYNMQRKVCFVCHLHFLIKIIFVIKAFCIMFI